MFMVSVIDAALAAQNVSVAAESMGLGICYIGGIRNELDQVTEVLGTPDHVFAAVRLGSRSSRSSVRSKAAPAETSRIS